MKKFVIKLVCFLGFFALFFVLINIIFLASIAKTDYDFKKRLESIKFEDPVFDLLVLGASTAEDAFDAELFKANGFSCYNLAIGGSTIRTNLVQLEEYLDMYSTKPRRVLLGLNSTLVDEFDNELIHPIVEVTLEGHKYKIEDVPILKFKWLGFEFLKKIVSKTHRNAIMVYGQVRFQKIVPDNTSFLDQYLDLAKFESSYWLSEITTFCNQNDIELIIIEMPGVRETQNLSEIGPHTISFNNGTSATLHNLNSREFCEIFDSNKDWTGNSHINAYGAIKFTKEIIRILEK